MEEKDDDFGSFDGADAYLQELHNVQLRSPVPDAIVAVLKVSRYPAAGFEVLAGCPFALDIDAGGFLLPEAEAHVESFMFPTKVWVLEPGFADTDAGGADALSTHGVGGESTGVSTGVFAPVPPRQAVVRGPTSPNGTTTLNPCEDDDGGHITERVMPRIAEFSAPLPRAGLYGLQVFSGNTAYGPVWKLRVRHRFDFRAYARSAAADVSWTHPGAVLGACEFRVRVTPLPSGGIVRRLLPMSVLGDWLGNSSKPRVSRCGVFFSLRRWHPNTNALGREGWMGWVGALACACVGLIGGCTYTPRRY
jgi:hypothetical protein